LLNEGGVTCKVRPLAACKSGDGGEDFPIVLLPVVERVRQAWPRPGDGRAIVARPAAQLLLQGGEQPIRPMAKARNLLVAKFPFKVDGDTAVFDRAARFPIPAMALNPHVENWRGS
jgi:hypothetical protein